WLTGRLPANLPSFVRILPAFCESAPSSVSSPRIDSYEARVIMDHQPTATRLSAHRPEEMSSAMSPRNPITGFLPWRGTFMIDMIVVAMVFVLVALGWSVYSVKYRKRYQRHKATQLCLAGGLLVVLVCFEVDTQFFENWRQRADASPYYDAATRSGLVVY